jgi:hypothetical protein
MRNRRRQRAPATGATSRQRRRHRRGSVPSTDNRGGGNGNGKDGGGAGGSGSGPGNGNAVDSGSGGDGGAPNQGRRPSAAEPVVAAAPAMPGIRAFIAEPNSACHTQAAKVWERQRYTAKQIAAKVAVSPATVSRLKLSALRRRSRFGPRLRIPPLQLAQAPCLPKSQSTNQRPRAPRSVLLRLHN